jgi:LPS export ABC transporter permease LptF
MRTLNLYIARKLLFTTLAATGVLTFALLSGSLIKVFAMMARGVSPSAVGMLVLLMIPTLLKYTIPLALLCAVILVFSRLAADNELTAMRASGVGVWQIVSPALLLGVLGSLLSFYLQMSLAPHCRMRMDALKEDTGASSPLALIEAGRFIELPGDLIYVGKRTGDHLQDLHVYGLDREGRMVVQDITAQEGEVNVDEAKGIINLVLYDAVVVASDPSAPKDASKLQHIAGQTMSFPLNYRDQINSRSLSLKPKYMDSADIVGMVHVYSERGINPDPLYLELHKRMSMALSPFAFVLIGIPFGIRSRRSEAAVGLLVSLVLAAFFFTFLILADTLKSHVPGQAQILVWFPNILYQIGGLIALLRLARH